jgi:putative ubiquitin-RnfH superfamily antitoxin RatB of RatAB toxin-antitoxin module
MTLTKPHTGRTTINTGASLKEVANMAADHAWFSHIEQQAHFLTIYARSHRLTVHVNCVGERIEVQTEGVGITPMRRWLKSARDYKTKINIARAVASVLPGCGEDEEGAE